MLFRSGPLSTIDDLKAYHAMLVETSGIVRKAIQEGKTLDQVKEAGLPAKYASWGNGFMKTPNWIQILYTSLSKK